MSKLSVDEQVELFIQGTEYGDDNLKQSMAQELRERLIEAQREGRPLRVYCGFDPRTSDLHLGHTVQMRKMLQFQEQGHEVTFVVGTFTSLIGDPSDQDKVRSQISLDQAIANAQTYADQALKILDPEKTRFEYNHTWLSKLTFEDVIELASLFTVQQFLTRENFRNRFEDGDPIFLHETFYALMQAYDAYHLRADVQSGGTDQLFNIITAARKLMEAKGERPNIGIIMGILPGTDGVVKMSKSLGNHIPMGATPEDMFGKVMSIPDQAMGSYYRLLSRLQPSEISEIERSLEAGELHPRDVKMRLAHEIVSVYQGEEAANRGEEHFRKVFQAGGAPDEDEMEKWAFAPGTVLLDFLTDTGLSASRSEARRLIAQGGLSLDGEPIEDPFKVMDETISGSTLRVGKRRFIGLKLKEE